jgi:hypothetical protein
MEADDPDAAVGGRDHAHRFIPGAAGVVEVRDRRAGVAESRVEQQIAADRRADQLGRTGLACGQRERERENRDERADEEEDGVRHENLAGS